MLALLPLEGDHWHDYSGNGNHGTVTGATKTAKGNAGPAWQFDGIDDKVTVANAPSLDTPQALTIAVCGYPTAYPASGYARLLDKVWNVGWAFYLRNPAGEQHLRFLAHSVGISQSSDNGVVSLNTRQVYGVTYDRVAVRFWVDGVYCGGGAEDVALPETEDDILIGTDGAFASPFKGWMEWVVTFNRALSAAEMVALNEWGRF